MYLPTFTNFFLAICLLFFSLPSSANPRVFPENQTVIGDETYSLTVKQLRMFLDDHFPAPVEIKEILITMLNPYEYERFIAFQSTHEGVSYTVYCDLRVSSERDSIEARKCRSEPATHIADAKSKLSKYSSILKLR